MNKSEFQRAYDMAVDFNRSFEDVNTSMLDGFALPEFKPVTVTIEAVASIIRQQCCYLGGGIDQEALNECRECFRSKVTMVG